MFAKLVATLRHWLALVTYSWCAIGPRILASTLFRYGSDPEARNVDSGFDTRFGTDTNAALTPSEARLPEDRRGAATLYVPTLDQDLDAMLAALGWSDALLRQTSFVDVGSGKGRAVLLAAMRRFREVIGVELSPVLHEIATRNVALVAATGALVSPVRLSLGDATELAVPRGPLIAYLYHPFREPIAEQAIGRLCASLAASPRPAAILYGHPTLQRPLDARVFAHGGVFRQAAAGARTTRRFRIGWTIWTNQAWLDEAQRSPWFESLAQTA